MLFKYPHQNFLKKLSNNFLPKKKFMKRTFSPFFVFSTRLTVFLIAFMVLCGIAVTAQSYTISFTNAPPALNDPLLDQNDGPGFGNTTSSNAIEVGVRFRVSRPGFVTAIRFLKGTGQAGLHSGHLWSSDGSVQLAQEQFTETPDGWQEVTLTTPVHIIPSYNYVASVYSANGDYQSELFSNFNWVNYQPPLIPDDFGTHPIFVVRSAAGAGADVSFTGNGLYRYFDSPPNVNGLFPNQYSGNNYWIDIRFVPDFPLPVMLAGFRAITTSNDVLLNWKTESEYNNKGFEIQRSNNGNDWYAVNFIDGVVESATGRNYSYTDKGLAPGLYYYRLKQVDNDGVFRNSPVVTATISGKGRILLFQNSPNPFRSTATIRFDLPNAQKVRLSILDILGREVKVLTNKQSEAGSHLIPVDATGLSRQLYYIRLQTESGTLTRNMLVE